eukprot:1823898-Rhodomonas_salina.1
MELAFRYLGRVSHRLGAASQERDQTRPSQVAESFFPTTSLEHRRAESLSCCILALPPHSMFWPTSCATRVVFSPPKT